MNASLTKTRLLGLLTVSLAATSAAAQGLVPTKGQVVAEPGDAPIGVAAGEVFGTSSPFDSPVLSHDGDILFRGALTGGATTTLNNRGLFLGRTKGDLKLILRAGDLDPSGTYPNSVLAQVSSGSGLPLGSNLFSTQRISPNGIFLMHGAQLYDGGNPGLDGLVHTSGAGTVNNTVLYYRVAGTYQILAQQNTTLMPGGAVLSSSFSSLSHQATALNNSGKAIFKSSLAGGDVTGFGNDQAWIIGTPGNLDYFVREGESVLGGANAIAQSGIGFNCVLNSTGLVLHDEKFSQTDGTSPATPFDDQVVMITDTSTGAPYTHNVLVREGDTVVDATGTPIVGVTYGAPSIAQGFSDTGLAAWSTTMQGAVTSADSQAVFIGGLGGTVMVAREGDVVPGTGGETMGVINSTMNYSEGGGVLFGASLVQPGVGGVTNLNDSFLAVGKPGQPVQVLVREGDACPGLAGFTFGRIAGSSNFGSSSSHRNNERGQVMFTIYVNDGVSDVNSTWSWDPVHGAQLQVIAGDVFGGGTITSPGVVNASPSGDGNTLGMNHDGDFVIEPGYSGGSCIARGHIGSLRGTPSAVPVTGGVPHFFEVDAGPTQAFQFYVILATSLGSEPGFVGPFGPQNIPLNPDPLWTDLSLNAANSSIWVNTLGVTDATGKGVGPAGFVMPAGFPGFAGTTLHHMAAVLDLTLVQTFVTEPVACLLY
jgi:hypothetical protein